MCQGVADIAQSVERILGKDEVPSSNLGISSRKTVYFMCTVFFFPIIFPIIEEEKSGNRENGKIIITIRQFYIKIINGNINIKSPDNHYKLLCYIYHYIYNN